MTSLGLGVTGWLTGWAGQAGGGERDLIHLFSPRQWPGEALTPSAFPMRGRRPCPHQLPNGLRRAQKQESHLLDDKLTQCLAGI